VGVAVGRELLELGLEHGARARARRTLRLRLGFPGHERSVDRLRRTLNDETFYPATRTGSTCYISAAVKLLLTGGAGYIGSIVAARLLDSGHEVAVLDDLSRGHRAAVPEGAAFHQVDLLDAAAVHAAAAEGFDAAVHFAALALVSESVVHPERYWRTNVGGTRNLLDALRDAGIRRLVFSSTCATYGQPDRTPITESTPTRPSSPYGTSKLAVDMMIADECAAHELGAVSLRYFNVAGASHALGEDHEPETHLIPNVLRAIQGRLPHVEIYGTDYDTPDGTAIRDYIHIEDLSDAHELALTAAEPGVHKIYNLGNGAGFSVREVIAAAERVTGRDVPTAEASRRPGDPPILVAASEKIRDELGWSPRKPALEDMIGDAWDFAQRHPRGY
jgi:UDP-glucose 4-epimerase